jgi:mono/diheme cytochrome c family protein
MKKFLRTGAQASAILFSSALIYSCDIDAQKDRAFSDNPGTEYAPQMYNSIPYEALKQEEDNKYNPSGMNMRVPARNTVARGKMGFNDYTNDTSTMEVMGASLRNPLMANDAVVEDGKVLYTRFCAPCHGEGGAGDGLVAPKFKGVANLTSAAIKAKPEGHIYQVITKGKGRMMPHNTQVNPLKRNDAILEDGKVLYERFCAHCHGTGGAGDGLVAPKFKGVANLTSGAIKVKPEAHIYQVITKGKGRMMPHNTQVNPTERWKIAMYVKQVIQGEGGAAAENVDAAGSPEDAATNQNTNPVTGVDAPAPGSSESTNPVKK